MRHKTQATVRSHALAVRLVLPSLVSLVVSSTPRIAVADVGVVIGQPSAFTAGPVTRRRPSPPPPTRRWRPSIERASLTGHVDASSPRVPSVGPSYATAWAPSSSASIEPSYAEPSRLAAGTTAPAAERDLARLPQYERTGFESIGSSSPSADKASVTANGRAQPEFGRFSLRDLPVQIPLSEVQGIIEKAAAETGLHPALLVALVRISSAFHPYKISTSGRIGLAQLPREIVEKAHLENPFDPYENVLTGARYLKTLVDEFDSVRLALAAYAETPDLVRKQADGARPKEATRLFVGDVLRAYDNLVIVYLDQRRR